MLQVTHIIADCNVCSSSQLACVADQQYAMCTNGIPNLQTVNSCPVGFVCSTFGAPICQDASDPNNIQDCVSCNKCDVTETFACTSQNTFALCLGTQVPSDKYTGTCAPDAVCNVNFHYICASPDDDGASYIEINFLYWILTIVSKVYCNVSKSRTSTYLADYAVNYINHASTYYSFS